MKKFISFFTIFFILAFSFTNIVQAKPTPPKVSADGAVILDATTGQILYSKNADTAYPPASTTKIMTALLTLENCSLDEEVVIGKNPPRADGSKIYIYEGEKLTVKQLLYGLLLSSANDCAEALAEHIGGSIEGFASMMNERAKELGCENTNFVNPSGLYDDKHRTSAKDLALILQELTTHSEFKQIATTSSYKILPTNKCSDEKPLWNENRLIQKYSKYYYAPAEGGKTGYTVQSLHSYVASASKNNHRLIVTLVHDGKKTFFKDSVALFNYGFENFELKKLYSKGDIVDTYKISDETNIPLIANKDFYYVKEKGDTNTPQTKITNNSDLDSKTIKKGDIISKCKITYKNQSLGTVQLTSGRDYEPKRTFLFNNTTSSNDKSNISKYIIGSLVIISAAFIFILLMIKKHKKRKRKKEIYKKFKKRS
ncbi:D-alanyl-D-alanine carboxypeptidase family protein [Haloimpatiens sp. FM7330]|uniref:D-alanyl-D-alanine carboxypeptidase family protein n=1 Tax=Haloimpatiens sp. FM7330 TaxID=3298610 RepID=UPI0036436F74